MIDFSQSFPQASTRQTLSFAGGKIIELWHSTLSVVLLSLHLASLA